MRFLEVGLEYDKKKFSFEKSEWKISVRKPRQRWEKNKSDLKKLTFEDLKMNAIDFTVSSVRLLRLRYLYSGSIKKNRIFDHLGDYRLSKKELCVTELFTVNKFPSHVVNVLWKITSLLSFLL
jgi:hypothetical protein